LGLAGNAGTAPICWSMANLSHWSPGFDELAVGDSGEAHAADGDGFVGGGDAEAVAGVAHGGGPADEDFVAVGDGVFDF